MFDPEDNTWVPPEDVATKCPMGDGGKPVCVPRAHFDTFLWSFITVFQILSGENWNAVMYDGMRSTGWPACFYFMTVMIIGNFVVLNLFLAILMASFDNERQKMAESREAEKKAKKVEDDAGPGGSKEAWGEEPSSSQGPIGVVPSGPEASASPRPKAQPRRGSVQSILANLGFGKQRDGSTKSTMGIMDAVKELAERSGFQQRCGSKSLFLFEEGSSIREAAIGLVTNPRFDHVIMVMIAASSLLMAVENPLMDPNSTTVKVLEVFNLLFTLIFLLEMVVKMIAMGVFCGQGEQPAYLGSAWNILDGAICIVSVTDTVQTFSNLASSGGIIAVMKVFRVVRMLRPLRLISRNENLKMVVKTVLGSVPELGKLLAFSSLFFVIFALLGVSNFRGSFFSCKNSALGEYSYDRGLGVTPLCIPNSTVLSLAAPGSLESMQFVALESDSGCPADFDQWRRPTVDTPVCEVHCDSDRGASNTFCQNKTRGPWGYHIMRCTDCSSSSCSEDPGKRSSCTSYCDRHEFFCTDKAAQGRSECLTQCVAQCMCEFSCVGLIQDAALCVEQGGRWVNMNQNFDDVIVGMISLFEISTTEGWVDMMLASVDSTGPYKQPRRDENEVLGTLLFVAFILIGSFFVLNLCVGVIIDNYQKQKDLQQRLMVTSAQEEWMTYLKALYLKKTFFTQVNIASLGPSRQHRYRIISSPNFENFILACIVMNTIALTMVWQPRATGEVEKVLSLVNLLFIAVFHFEAFMKISALHLNYFREFWNLFDFTCVLAGDIVSIAEASAGADGSANLGSLVSALRIFRVARLFRLIRSLKGLNKLLLAFALSVPKLLNVGLLLVLLIYLYAVLGVSLFAKVEYTGVGVYSETVNFRSFFKAVGVLIRSMTGEGWNEIMHDLSKGEFFYQSVLGLRCEVPMDFGSTPFSELDRDGDGLVDNPTECGTPLAYVYFISYTCIVTFVILNLFIAVIFEGFEESKSNEVSNFVQQCLDNWARYDRFNTMALPLGKALDFIDETVDDLLSKIPPIKRCMLEKRWDPNSSTDLFASEAMWALYNMKYVRTLGLTIRPDESVRLVVAMRAVIRRYLVSSTPAGKMLIGFEKRSKVEELEVLEQMLQDTNSPKELQDLRLLELDQSRHINYVLKLEQSTFNRFFGRSAGPSPVEEQRPSNRRMSWFQQMLATKPCCFVVHSARSVLIMGLFSIACFIRSMLFLAVFIVYLYLLCECFLYCCVFAVLFVCLGLTDLVTAAICRCLVCITACVVVVTIPVSLLSLSC
ncbi:unnamed protein product [Polarella glacialis]|uniref:Ion transport domain-containing protein n=1 Tax=Polarella glacialis TaxID=89957 RepID=A0A813JTV1_POLGL|nr:unnamed protein product [Polarella glacialis]